MKNGLFITRCLLRLLNPLPKVAYKVQLHVSSRAFLWTNSSIKYNKTPNDEGGFNNQILKFDPRLRCYLMKTKESCDQHQNKNESIGIAEHSSQDYHAISNLADKLLKVEKDAQELKMMDGTYFSF